MFARVAVFVIAILLKNNFLFKKQFLCWGQQMFEVYLNHKRDLLVVKKGSPLPLIGESEKWRMKRKVLRVSDEIRSAVQKHGYYVRKLSDAKNGSLPPIGLAHSFGRYVADQPPMPGV